MFRLFVILMNKLIYNTGVELVDWFDIVGELLLFVLLLLLMVMVL